MVFLKLFHENGLFRCLTLGNGTSVVELLPNKSFHNETMFPT